MNSEVSKVIIMVSLNPLAKQVNFGADVAPISVPIVPANTSLPNPIQSQLGYMQTDLYGTQRQPEGFAYPYSDSYDKYLPSNKKEEYKSNLVSAGLLAGGIGMAFVAGFFILKNVFSKKKELPHDIDVKFNPKDIRPPKESIGLVKFDSIVEDAYNKLDNEGISKIKLPTLRVLFNKEDGAAKKEALIKLNEFSKIYTNCDCQPQVKILMPESMEDDANKIINYLAANRIDEIPAKQLEKIDGFQIVKIAHKKGRAERNDRIFYAQVSHGVNGSNAGDVGKKWYRNIAEWVRDIF